ncbi:GGDEF domain-containing protein [Kitasatospora sp. NPDC052896]|uniref:GGDEF domain-containing protein n=1 Tax=Kitasatospora sp. NPDC052896 TaxID=3364061 RepID=UPI0037C9E299
MPTPLLVQALALFSVPLAGLSGVLAVRLRRAARSGRLRESGLREQLAELAGRCEELAGAAAHDPQTGVWNYRHLRATLEQEIERCTRPPAGRPEDGRPQEEAGPRPLAVVLLEVEGFDAITAEHGRGPGTVLLRELAHRLSVEIRRSDTLGRYGDAEFLAVLPGTDAAGAAKVAERLCWAVRRHRLLDWPTGSWVPSAGATPAPLASGLTAVAGVAVLPADGTHAVPLLRAADRALAAAKHGRDRSETHGSLSACAGSGHAALAGSIRTVPALAAADEVRSWRTGPRPGPSGQLPE